MNKYYSLTENLSNELELLHSKYDKNDYDFRKKFLMYDKNDEEKLVNEYIDNRYINTDINNE